MIILDEKTQMDLFYLIADSNTCYIAPKCVLRKTDQLFGNP